MRRACAGHRRRWSGHVCRDRRRARNRESENKRPPDVDDRMVDVKQHQTTDNERDEAADAKRDADYKVAAEKCDALAGDAKAGCIANAKARFGQT